MHTDVTPTGGAPSLVSARARVRVIDLDARGHAVARIEVWLTTPSADEWCAIFGQHAADHALPERCEFVGGLPEEVLEVEFHWPVARPGRRLRRLPQPRTRVRTILTASPDRTNPRCPVFGECGGCQLQHLRYERQLAWKTERVRRLLDAAGMTVTLVEPAIGCADPWHYRNHMRFSVNRHGQPGLTARGSHRVLPLRECPIAHPLINRTLELVQSAPCPRPQLLIRCGTATKQVLVQPFPDEAMRAGLAAAGINVHEADFTEALQDPDLDPSRPGSTRHAPTLEFRIRPSSFFQTNTGQANHMAAAVLGNLPTGPDVTLVDAYCGVGTFAALLAPHAGKVLAIEESASAVRDARWNLRHFAHVEVIQAKTEDVLPTLNQTLDGLIIDPPRAGCQSRVLEALRARHVPRVVYVSCDPVTLVRDLAFLCQDGIYRLARIQPLDMFPQTAHIETIATLEIG